MGFIRDKRIELWKANPYCEKCGILTILPEDVPGVINLKTGVKQMYDVPDNMATIQHRYDRWSGMKSLRDTPYARALYLWCNKCNFLDGVEREKQNLLIKKINQMNKQGALLTSLLRNPSAVKKERAEMINRAGAKYYKRRIEDLQSELEELIAGRDAQLDMSPSDINKIVTAAEFQSKDFCEKDMDFTIRIREVRVQLEEFIPRYETLFGSLAADPATAAAPVV